MLPCRQLSHHGLYCSCAFLLPSFHSVLFVVDSFPFSSGSDVVVVRVISAFLPSFAVPHPHLAAFYCVNCSLLPPARPLSPCTALLLLGGGLAILFLLSPLVSDSLLILPPAPRSIPHPLSPSTKFRTSEKSPSGSRGSALVAFAGSTRDFFRLHCAHSLGSLGSLSLSGAKPGQIMSGRSVRFSHF